MQSLNEQSVKDMYDTYRAQIRTLKTITIALYDWETVYFTFDPWNVDERDCKVKILGFD